MELNDTVKMELSDTELSSMDIAAEASLLPEKSKFKYEKQFQIFSEWCDSNQVKLLSEDVLLEYFNEKSKTLKSSTVSVIFSMLRPTLLEQKDVDIKKFKKLLAFLKQQSVEYKPKKSKILQRIDIYKFLVEAPDKQYLMKKVALILGLAGSCHREELTNLSIDDIEDQNSILIIKIQDTRTRGTRVFSLKNNGENSPDLLSYYRKYLALRPTNVETRRLFLKYGNGVCSRQVVGINTISKIPRDVASYLGVPDFDTYTGHCFRSSSESFLSDAVGDWSSNGRFGRLKASTSVTEKSKSKYEKQYQVFSDWCGLKHVTNFSEQVLLEYFNEKSKVYNSKSSTLWALFSMLRTELIAKNDLDIKTYKKLLAFLKQQAVGYKPKKSKILRKSEIYKFLAEAPDKKYLMKKVILIFGVAGACLRQELINLSIDDIEDQKSIVIVKIPDNKTRTTRTFLLQNYGKNDPDLLSYYRKYASLRPSSLETRRLFVKYSNGICQRQVVGINTIGKIPREVASYLGLSDCDAYTGHCFRRSSQSFLAYDGENFLNSKSLSSLKSTPIAENHIDNSNKVSSVAKKIFCDIMDYPLSTDCAVLNCKTKRKNGTHFFKCSNDYDNYKLWLQNCHIVPSNRKPHLICSKHFESQCFLKGKLKRSAVPTLFLPNQANVSISSEIYNLQNGVPVEDIDQINSNQETEFSEFECDEETDSIKAQEFFSTDIIKEEPNITLEAVKKEPSVSFSDDNSSLSDTEAYSSINEESSNSPIHDESPKRKDFQFCNTNSSTTCNCSNRLIQLENNQEEIKIKLDQLLELVRDITIRN